MERAGLVLLSFVCGLVGLGVRCAHTLCESCILLPIGFMARSKEHHAEIILAAQFVTLPRSNPADGRTVLSFRFEHSDQSRGATQAAFELTGGDADFSTVVLAPFA